MDLYLDYIFEALSGEVSFLNSVLFIYIFLKGFPQIQPFFFPIALSVGQKASVSCGVIKGTLPLKFKWIKNGNELMESENIKIHAIEDVSLLAIDPVKQESGGNYTCVVSNSFGKDEYTAMLMVKGKWYNVFTF